MLSVARRSAWAVLLATLACTGANPRFRLGGKDATTVGRPGEAGGDASPGGDGSPSLGPGAALHWRFDEDSGAALAQDASGNGFHGSYAGESTTPQPSTSVPPTSFPNPRSRSFASSGRPCVQLAAVDPRLKAQTNMTLTVWFRASSAAGPGSDLLNVGGDLLLRLWNDGLEVSKRKSNVEGTMYAVARGRGLTGHLDGRWHHAAGVVTPEGLDVYLDGVPREHRDDTLPILYRSSGPIYAGRDALTDVHDFRGDLDDARIYTRALTASEIAALAAGGP